MKDQTFFHHRLVSKKKASLAFLDLGIQDFGAACTWVQQLPYRRNIHKGNALCVLEDGYGTCSTKHALLQQLVDENEIAGVELVVGIYMMDDINTPGVGAVLRRAQLDALPEAHCYLKVGGEVMDFTFPKPSQDEWTKSLVAEHSFSASDVVEQKLIFHRSFLQQWLADHPQYDFNLEQIWTIREACIQALSMYPQN